MLTSIDHLQDGSLNEVNTPVRNLVYLFNRHLESKPAETHRKDGVHASEICQCMRQTGYSVLKTKKEALRQAEMEKRFLIGNAVHAMLQFEFHQMAKAPGSRFTFEDEVRTDGIPFAEENYITSSCDGIFTFYDDDAKTIPTVRMGLEIKTEAPDSFAKLHAPRPKHIEQAHVYMKCFDLPLMWFCYWNKGNQNITPVSAPWVIKFNPDMWNKIQGRIDTVLTTLTQGQLPEKEEGYHCSWCPYAYTCEPKGSAPRSYGPALKPIRGR